MTTYLKPLREATDRLMAQAASGVTEETVARFNAAAETAERNLLNKLLELPDDRQPERFVRMQVQELIVLDDRLHAAMGVAAAGHVGKLRAMARKLALTVPGVDVASLPMPRGVVQELAETRSDRLEKIAAHLREAGVEEALVGLVALIGEARGVRTLGDHRYLNRLLGELETFRFIPIAKGKASKGGDATAQLVHLLIQSGYNHLRFFHYCAAGILHEVKRSHSREARLKVLDEATQTIRALKPLGHDRYEPDFDPIDAALLAWIAEETEVIGQDTALVDTEAEYHQLLLEMDVHELALMARLFREEGLVERETLESYARKLAFHFSTKGRERITDTSLRTKMSAPEETALIAVGSWLQGMAGRVETMMKE